MQLTHHRVNLAAFAEQGQPPHDIIPREPSQVWVVSHDAIRMDQPLKWRRHEKGTHVYIPLVPYLMLPEPDLALAFMLQLGMRCSLDVGHPVKRLHIATGVPVNDVWSEETGRMWQYYIGFALVLD